MEISMNSLRPGQQGTVKRIMLEESLARRLTELGFAPGIRVYCCGCSPMNELLAVSLGDRVVCLRRQDLCGVTLCGSFTEDLPGTRRSRR